MITRYYGPLLRIVGLMVALCSGISACLIWAAPPPSDLKNLDPNALKTTSITLLLVLGCAAPLGASFLAAQRRPLLNAAVFAIAGFSNAAMLSPLIAVPFQSTTSALAMACGLALAVISILVALDAIQDKKPESKF
ncbi:hypothetical protein AB6813_10265 [bacterium RCC_150]